MKNLFILLLFVFFNILFLSSLHGQTLIMNEVSNGPAGNQEYVEFIIIDTAVTYNCTATTPPCIDIRGWIFDDNSGYHGTAGIAAGAVRFSFDPLWACVPLGTIIVIYNNADPNPSMPADDLSLTDGNCRIIAPISNLSLFEKNSTTPGAIACSYPTTGWTAGGAWTNTLLANTGDCARIVNLAGCEVFSVCWASNNLNNLIYFNSGGSGSQNVWSFNDGDPMLQANWTEGSTASNQTPGAANNAANQAYINQFNNGCSPITPIVVTATSINAGCSCTGSATASASGSIPGYTYNWFNSGFTPIGQTSVTASDLCAGTYYVIATSSIGCSDTASVIITASGSTTVSVNSQTICAGISTSLTATPSVSGGTYLWSPGGQTTQTITVNPALTTVYSVTYTLSGCSATNSGTVTVNPLPLVNAGTDQAICIGASTILTASGANTYTWSPAAGLSGTTSASVTATPAATTTYTVSGTSAAGCVNTDLVTVTINSLPIVGAGTDQIICIGASVTLSGSGASTYAWNNGVTNGVAFNPISTTTYNVTGTSAAGCVNTDQVLVTVNPLPTVVANDISVCASGTVTVAASGANTYSWSPATSLSATTGANVTFTAGATTIYTVTGTSAAGCVNTDPVTVTVLSNAPINAGPDVAICVGASTTLTATGGATYTWNNGLGTGNNFSVSPATTTTYTVVGTDAGGCTGTDAITVTVNPLPIPNAGTDQTVCAGASVTLTATGAATYSWDNGITNGIAFTPTATTTFSVVGTTAAGCTATDAVLVTVNPLPIVNSGLDQTVCAGASVTLTPTGAATYTWSPVITSGVAFVPASTTTYTVTGTSAAGCISSDAVLVTVNPLPTLNAGTDQTICSGTSVSLSGSGASAYSWSPVITNGVAFTPAATTTYTVTGTNVNGCINTDQVTVTVNPLPSINAGTDQTVCVGASVTLTASGGASYSWDNGISQGVAFTPTATTIFTVSGTSVAGCVNTDQVIVNVNPLPTISAGPDQSVCVAGSVTLSGTGGIAYTWNNGVSNGVAFVPATTAIYTVTGTDINGCINTDQVTVNVLSNAPINAGSDVMLCVGQSTTITATGGTIYNWDNALGTGNGFNVTPTGTTTYTLIGTDVNGCTGTDAITVTVSPLPIVNAGTDQTVCQGTSVTLTATGAAIYSWDNGITNGVSFTPSFGTITYTVIGTTVAGCTATDAVVVTVNSLPVIDAGIDQIVCSGTTVTLIAAGANSYSWSNGINQGVPFTPVVGSITYTVTGTTAAGCISTDQVTVTVNALPTTNSGADQTLCEGGAVNLAATGATTYTWDNGVTNGVSFTPAIGTLTYNVTGTSADGCIASDQVIVTVNPNPAPVIQGPTEYCTSSTATLSTSVLYTTYTWSTGATTPTVNVTQGNNPITVTVTNGFGCQTTSSAFTVTENSVITANFTVTICQGESAMIHGITQTVAGVYSITLPSGSGCDSIANVTLVINPLPTVNAGTDQAVCAGTATTLTATGAANYAWNNGVTNGIPFTQAIGTISYTVSGTDVNGCINTDQVVITVNPLPTINGGVDQVICIGATVTLTGSGGNTYSWNNGVTNGVVFTPAVTTTYTVSGTDINGCINTDQIDVTVNPLPAVNAGIDQTTCIGGTITLSASGAYSYTWNNGVTNGVSFTPVATSTYTVTGTDANGCVNTDQVVITVAGLPNVNAGIDQTVCSGTAITLSGSGASAYTWSNSVVNGVSIVPAVGTVTYTVSGTDAGGCINTDQVVVTVNPLPIIDAGPDQEVCVGEAVTLTATGGTTYTWNNGITHNVPFSPSVSTTYTVTGTDANGCTSTDQAVITVNPLPLVNAGLDQTICIGTSVTLSGSAAATYTWNNGVVNGVVFAPTSTTTYTVTGTDADGCTNTDQVLVTVNPLPIVNAGVDQAICIGASATLVGSGASTYTWTAPVVNNVAFSPTTTNTYSVSGTDANGCINTDQVIVTVNPLPIVGASADQAVCAGTPVTLSGSGAATYTWNNSVVNATAFTPSVTNTYTVTGTDVNGCINTDQVVVTVNPIPTVSAGADVTICIGETVTLSGFGAATYIWDNGVTNGTTFNPTTTTTYTLTGTTAAGCTSTDQVLLTVNPLPVVNAGLDQIVCLGTAVTLSGSGASTYSWSPLITNGVAFIPSVGTVTYTVTGTSTTGCLSTDQVVITVNSLPNINAGANQVVCAGEQVILSASGAATYSWNNSIIDGVAFTPSMTTTYTVTGTSAVGCINTDQLVVTVNPIPSVLAGNDITICQGQTATLTGSGANTYSWDNAVTNGVAFTPSAGTTTYTVTGTSNAGCINTDEVTITVGEITPVTFVADNTSGCAPLTVTFTCTTPGSSNYIWTMSDGTVIFGSAIATNTFNNAGCYDISLSIINESGCESSFSAISLVCVEEIPIADFSQSSFIVSEFNSTVEFYNESIGAINYSWNFGNESSSFEVNPTHDFTNMTIGSHTITLIATSSFGCADTAYSMVEMQEELIYYVPNTFTPDNDNFNQTFKPVFTAGYDPYDYSLMIFNRWGEIIFESHNTDIGWDGSYGDKDTISLVQDGVYTWKIEFKTSSNDERKMAIGHVNMLR